MRESFGECVRARVSGCLYLNIIQTHKWRSCQRRWEHTVHKDLLSRSFSLPLSFFSPFFTLWGTHGISLVLLPHRDKWAHVCLYVWARRYICLCENMWWWSCWDATHPNPPWRLGYNYGIWVITDAAFKRSAMLFFFSFFILSSIMCVHMCAAYFKKRHFSFSLTKGRAMCCCFINLGKGGAMLHHQISP